jgi:hypothetical protein
MFHLSDFQIVSRYRRLVSVADKLPIVKQDAWIAPNSALFGDVTLGQDSTIWYGTTIRGKNLCSIIIFIVIKHYSFSISFHFINIFPYIVTFNWKF